MFENIILGAIQGIAEWLPVSSEGLLVLAKLKLFGTEQGLAELLQEALWLHLGTFLAALVYFREDIGKLLRALTNFRSATKKNQNTLKFLITATLISGLIGWTLFILIDNLGDRLAVTGKILTFALGIFLLVTGILQIRAKDHGLKTRQNLTTADGILLGFVQGLAALPGLSRSGLTVSALLLRQFDKAEALKLSFLMGLPIVLGGNIVLNFHSALPTPEQLIGVTTSFLFGLLTIHGLLKLAHRLNFGYFVLLFGLLTLVSTAI